jgi:hypothetical protein
MRTRRRSGGPVDRRKLEMRRVSQTIELAGPRRATAWITLRVPPPISLPDTGIDSESTLASSERRILRQALPANC